MKHIYLLAILLTSILPSQAQTYVTIPDANFVAWLQTNVPSAMNGNQMDITDPWLGVLDYVEVPGMNISDLTGIEYFTALNYLDCSHNMLTSLPSLSAGITMLNCSCNQLASLPALPSTLIHLECQENQLLSLPAVLPADLSIFNCSGNHISHINSLPDNLGHFLCSDNLLTSLPALPSTLVEIQCDSNNISALPVLPNSMNFLICSNNQLISLPVLPPYMYYIDCDSNQISALPTLNDTLRYLFANNNLLNNLPALPNSLYFLDVGNNQLSSLTTLPGFLYSLNCENNNISCFPQFPQNSNLGTLKISGNPFTCLPNYISCMDYTLLSYPLCLPNDSVNNPMGCDFFKGICGSIFNDNNANCDLDSNEQHVLNIHVKLFDYSSVLIGETYSVSNGSFSFLESPGTYMVLIDTINVPFVIQCSYPGADSTIILDSSAAPTPDIKFPVDCKPGYDVGVQSVVSTGIPFPGETLTISINAGDISHWYNMECANGIGGQVQVTVTGPVSFSGVPANALLPVVNGSVFTYSVSDFGLINNTNDFGLIFSVDTAAQAGDSVCFLVSVTPVSGDNNPINNVYSYCSEIVNSYDPNYKEVYPTVVPNGYADYLTYTIHFQNVGTYNAINIRIADTLNSFLDFSTFELLNFSHDVNISLIGNKLSARFQNINLPDSASNPEGSCGFIQYRIKPVSGLPSWTHIPNTASIYFDYNAPVVTNTATCVFGYQGISENNDSGSDIRIFPNPASDEINIAGLKCPALVAVYDLSGKLLIVQNVTAPILNVGALHAGLYFVEVLTENGRVVERFIKE